MKPRDVFDLVLLAAIWGGSFIFMRLGAVEFGAVALTALRVAGGALCLLPLVLWRAQGAALRTHWRAIVIVGLINSAGPYALFALAALGISAGLSSILNATAPLWTVLIAWGWMHERPGVGKLVGIGLGIAGVAVLVSGKTGVLPADHGVGAGTAITACLLATLGYGIAANLSKRWLAGVPPLAVAAGSQGAAALALAAPAWWLWPKEPPGAAAWGSAAALAVVCTGVALLLYFRLIARLGPSRAITVTFLIPLFGVLWGAWFLGEALTLTMLLGGAVILVGTGLVTGVVTLDRWLGKRTKQNA